MHLFSYGVHLRPLRARWDDDVECDDHFYWMDWNLCIRWFSWM